MFEKCKRAEMDVAFALKRRELNGFVVRRVKIHHPMFGLLIGITPEPKIGFEIFNQPNEIQIPLLSA